MEQMQAGERYVDFMARMYESGQKRAIYDAPGSPNLDTSNTDVAKSRMYGYRDIAEVSQENLRAKKALEDIKNEALAKKAELQKEVKKEDPEEGQKQVTNKPVN